MGKTYTPKTDEERKAELQAIHNSLAEQVKTLTTSEGWHAMLRAAAQFHNYSLNNLMLVALQRPDATRVAGYKDWKKKFDRQVRSGETGIKILGPVKRWIEVEDEATGRKTKVQRVVGYRVLHVFDIAQTDGPELPDVAPKLLQGDGMADTWEAVESYLAGIGWSVERGDCGAANGYADHKRKAVRVRADVSGAQALKTLIHEAGHVTLGHTEDMAEYVLHRGRMEVEAESVAYVVLQTIGADTSPYSLPYIAAWQNDSKAVERTAERVIDAARRIITDAGLVQTPRVETGLEMAL